MAISFVGSAENSAINGGAITLTLPAGLQENDLVIVAFAVGDNDNIDEAMGITGWSTHLDLFANDTQDINLGISYKFMGATPDTSVTTPAKGGTDAACAVVCMAFRGVDTTTPFDQSSNFNQIINTMHPNPAPLSGHTVAGVWTVIAGASGHTLGGAGTYTFPAGYTTNALDRGSDDTSDCTVGMGYKTNPADPEDPGVMTHSGADSANFAYCSVTMALRPAPAGTAHERSVDDTVSLADALAFGYGGGLADSVSVADALAFERGMVLAETLTLADALAFERGMTLADSLGLADSATAERGIAQSVDDSVGVADQASLETGKAVSIDDTLALADALAFDRGLSLQEAVALADALKFDREMVVADNVSLSDVLSLQRDISQSIADAITLADDLTTDLQAGGQAHERNIDDTLSLADAIETALGTAWERSIADSVTLSDAISLFQERVSGEVAAAVRTWYNRRFGFY